ncbi:endolytic transglycosylase MltG [Asticcacaulis sp. EMRT-3]|uniref:endolytic transglycosylase MltG n=1 Tax=Asticcacaulis sp. EMRT-3 TaxID=3040349 RepID=UPI0024AF437F|nr:endolytic transglycosylase MltG [Asticcacaulis sp. EMRT-3]MDI7774581.1 endolytic transglycosylase MltG [Asticcacaulis sp. EMRT-3]
MPAEPAPRQVRSLLAPLAGLAAGILLLIFSAGLFVYAQLFGPGPEKASELTFAHGMSVVAVGHELEKQKVIHSALLFRIAARLRGHENGLKAGTYDFPAHASLISVLAQIEAGRVVQTYVTIPEGRTSAQAVRILMAVKNLTGDIDVPPEGSILPETYLYQPGETREAVLERMLEAGRRTLDELWAKRAPNLPYANKEEALIMASIVERETALPAERPRIAAVFINRLRDGMRLGSDPTVIYGISHGEPLGRGLTKTELETWSPWNTYMIDKLPVTPICNPGRAALQAVLNPAPTNDLYFVANGSGGHVFAATYAQHLANVAKWRAMESQVNVYTSSAVSDDLVPGVVAGAKKAQVPAAAVQLKAKS